MSIENVKSVVLISDKTGEEFKFPSRCEAAKFLGVDYSYLKQYLKKRWWSSRKEGLLCQIIVPRYNKNKRFILSEEVRGVPLVVHLIIYI